MRVRFQADADLNQIILVATVRQEPSIDFQTAPAAGLASLSDREVLAVAARAGRVLVTHDQRTMPRHFSYAEEDIKANWKQYRQRYLRR
jgi:hypothetical protein